MARSERSQNQHNGQRQGKKDHSDPQSNQGGKHKHHHEQNHKNKGQNKGKDEGKDKSKDKSKDKGKDKSKNQGKEKGENGQNKKNNKNPIVLKRDKKDQKNLGEVIKHLYADGQSINQIPKTLMKSWEQLLDDVPSEDLPFPDNREDVHQYVIEYLQKEMLLDEFLRDSPELEDSVMAEISKMRNKPAENIVKHLKEHKALRNINYSLSGLSEENRAVRIARLIRNCPEHQWSNFKKGKDENRFTDLSGDRRNNPFGVIDGPNVPKNLQRDYYGNKMEDGQKKRAIQNDQTLDHGKRMQASNGLGDGGDHRGSPMVLDDQTYSHWQKLQGSNAPAQPFAGGAINNQTCGNWHKMRGFGASAQPLTGGVVNHQTCGHWQQVQGFGAFNQPARSNCAPNGSDLTAMDLDCSPSIREILEKNNKLKQQNVSKELFGAPSGLRCCVLPKTRSQQQPEKRACSTKSDDVVMTTEEHHIHSDRDSCHTCRMTAQSRRRTAETRFETAVFLLSPDEMRLLYEKLAKRVQGITRAPWQQLSGPQALARMWYSLNRQDRDWCLHELEEHVKARRHLMPRLDNFRQSLRLLGFDELKRVAQLLRGFVFPPLADRKLSDIDTVADMWSRMEQVDARAQLQVEQWVRSYPFHRAIRLLDVDELGISWNSIVPEASPISLEDRRRLQVDNFQVLTDMWSRMDTEKADKCMQLLREHVKDRDVDSVNIKRFHDAVSLLTWAETSQVYSALGKTTGEVALHHWLSKPTPKIITEMWLHLNPKQRGEFMAQVEAQVRDRQPEGQLIQQVHSWMALLTVDEMRALYSNLALAVGKPTPALQSRLSPSLMLVEMWRLLDPENRVKVAEALEDRVRSRMLAVPPTEEPQPPSLIQVMNTNSKPEMIQPKPFLHSRWDPNTIKKRAPRQLYGNARSGKFSTNSLASLLQLEMRGWFDKGKQREDPGAWPDAHELQAPSSKLPEPVWPPNTEPEDEEYPGETYIDAVEHDGEPDVADIDSSEPLRRRQIPTIQIHPPSEPDGTRQYLSPLNEAETFESPFPFMTTPTPPSPLCHVVNERDVQLQQKPPDTPAPKRCTHPTPKKIPQRQQMPSTDDDDHGILTRHLANAPPLSNVVAHRKWCRILHSILKGPWPLTDEERRHLPGFDWAESPRGSSPDVLVDDEAQGHPLLREGQSPVNRGSIVNSSRQVYGTREGGLQDGTLQKADARQGQVQAQRQDQVKEEHMGEELDWIL